jgi:hypothetical protein
VATNLNRIRKLYVSADSKESTYGTAVATDSMLKVDAGVITNREVGVVSNNDLVGGTEEPTEQFLTNQSVALPIAQARVKPHTLATIATYGIGKVTTTTPSGASSARKHQITTSGSPTASMLSFTAEGILKSGVNQVYPGVFVDSFNFSVNRGANQFASLTSSCYGCGTVSSGSDNNRTEKDENPISGSTAGIAIGTGVYDGDTKGDNSEPTNWDIASATDITGQVTSFEYSYANNVDRDFLYQVGGGKVYNIAEKTARSQTITITKLWQDDTYRTGLYNQTSYSLQARFKGDQIGGEGVYYGACFTVPKAVLQSADVSDDGGRIVETLTFLPLWDATTGGTPDPFGSVIIDVFNTQTAYAA